MVWNSPFANTFSPRLRGRPADRGGGGGRGRLNSNVFQQRPPPPPSPSSSYGIAGGGIAAGVAGGGANRKWVNPLTLATASSVPPSDTAFTTLNPIPQQQLHQSASSSSFKTLSHGSTAVHQQRGGGARGGGRGAYSSSRRNSNNNINHHHHPPPTYQLPQQVQTQAINPTNFSKPASTVFISPLPPSNTPSQVINNNSNGPSNFIPSSIPSSSSFSSPDTSTAPLTLSHDPLLPPNHPYNSPDFIHRFNTDQALRKQALDIVHSTMSTTSSSDCAVMIVYQTDGSACLQQSKWSDLKDSMSSKVKTTGKSSLGSNDNNNALLANSSLSSSKRDNNNNNDDNGNNATDIELNNADKLTFYGRLREHQQDAMRVMKVDKVSKASLDEMEHGSRKRVAGCNTMCPFYECYEREHSKGLDWVETIPRIYVLYPSSKSPHPAVDFHRAVKKYGRLDDTQASSPMPTNLRFPDVLCKTVDYILTECPIKFQSATTRFETSTAARLAYHAFARDRLRSVRKEFLLLNLRTIEAVECHEKVARFHILFMHELGEELDMSDNLKPEIDEMYKSLKSLTEYYPLLRRQGIICPNEAEFQAYHILTHLFTANTVTEVEEKLIRQQNYPVYLDPRVQRAVAIHQMMHCNTKVVRSNKENAKPSLDGAMNAFTRLFRMITNSSSSSSSLSSSSSPSSPLSLPVDYLTGCILQSHFPIIRASALRAMQKAYIYDLDKPDSMMPIADLARMLGYTQDEQGLLELIAFVRSCEVPMLPEDAGCQQEGSMMMMSYSPSLHETVVLLGYFVDRTTEFRKNKLKKGPFTDRPPFTQKLSPIVFALRRGLLDEDITLARAGTKFSSLAAATSSVKPLFLQQPSQQQQQQQQQPPFVSNNFPPFNRSPLLSVPEHSTPNSFQQQPLQSQSAVQLNPNARSFTPRSDTNGTASTSVAVVTASDALLMQQKLVQKQEELMRRIAEQEAKQKEVVERRKIEHQQQLLFQQQQQQQKQQEESAAQAAAAAAQAAAAQAAVSMERIAQETAAAEAERQRRRFSLETREAERTRSHLQHTQMKQEMEQRRLERHDFTVQYTQHIIHTMAEQVVHEELMEILADVTADVNWRTLQSVYRMIVYEILDEDIVPRMTRELVYDEAAEFCFRAREARAKAAVVSRWRARLASIYESRRRELEALQLRAVKFYLDALGMESAPPIISGGGGDSMGNNKVVQPHPYYQSEYAHLAFSKVDTQYLSNLPKIDLASNLAPIIAKSQSAATSGRGLSFGMMDLHWKLVVSLPNGHSSSISRNNYNNSRPRTTSSNDLVELADEFCRRWIKTKLSSSEGTGNNQLGLSSEFETILKKTHALVSSTGSSSGPSLSNRRLLRILVQCVKSVSNTNNQTHQLDVKENAFAPCSGISAAVFQFSFVDTASQFNMANYWAQERNRLVDFISMFPAQSKIPLLLIYWSSSKEMKDLFYNEVYTQQNFASIITHDGPISNIQVLIIPIIYIPDIGPVFEDNEATSKLLEHLGNMASMCPIRPVLRTNVFSDLVEKKTLKHFEFLLNQVVAFNCDLRSVPVHVLVFNTLIDVYNDQLLAIQGVLTNGALRTLAYPAKEFSFWSYPHSFNTSSATSVSEEEEAEDDDGYYFQDYETSSSSSSATSGIPKVDWNSEESFASISESLAHFRLFYLASDFSNPISSVARLYDDYPIRMMNLPHVSRESLRMLTTDIWHYLLDHQGQDSQQVRPFPLVQILSSITNISLSALDYQISTHRICFYSPETIPGAVEWFKETSNGRIAGLRQKLKTLSAESLVNVSSPPRKRTYAGVLAKGADGSTTKITIGHRQNAPSSLTSLLASNGLKDHHENLDLSSSSPMKRPKALRQQLLLDLGDELEQAKRLLEMSKAGS